MFNLDMQAESERLWKQALPHISVDCVLFGFNENKLNVLLTRFKGDNLWFLLGGYIYKEEDLEEAAHRILNERSGAERIFLSNFGTFGSLNRSEGYFAEYDDQLWQKQRFITAGFYALVYQPHVQPVPDRVSDACEWVSIDHLPEMGMDHGMILNKALRTLQEHISYKPIGYNLLPEFFTLSDLQALYEAILGKKLNRGNFYRKIMRYDILIKTDQIKKGGAHKPANLYRFNLKNYQQALNEVGW